MKITEVKTYAVHPGWRKNLLFVKIETNAGIHGWGEAYSQYDRDRAVMAQLECLGPYLVGRSPFDIKHFTNSRSTIMPHVAARSNCFVRSPASSRPYGTLSARRAINQCTTC